MDLTFENSKGQERVIATVSTADEAFSEIKKFLNAHNYKMYYCRILYGPDFVTYDVGSHTEFFHLRHVSPEDIDKMRKKS